MRTVTHREMRNNSAELLRQVKSGERVLITNNGQASAVIGPPEQTQIDQLIATGRARAPRADLSTLRSLSRRTPTTPSADILRDVRGDR